MTTKEVTENGNAKGGKKIRRLPPKEFEQLKAERVQLVTEKLKIMPRWELTNDGTALRRVHEFSDARVALAYASYVAELSTAENVSASVLITGARAVVNVRGVRQSGFRNLTDKILGFAAELG
jgi:pterin-4a-carbinolamine dehydratase